MKKIIFSFFYLILIAGFTAQALSANKIMASQYQTLEFQYGSYDDMNWLKPYTLPCNNRMHPVQPNL